MFVCLGFALGASARNSLPAVAASRFHTRRLAHLLTRCRWLWRHAAQNGTPGRHTAYSDANETAGKLQTR